MIMQGQSQPIDWQGHRGCRGLMPENTIPAFLKAIDLGVQTLELDIVVSKDNKIVISHEPWMSAIICSHPDGSPVLKEEAMSLNLFGMTLEEIKMYDCGMRVHPQYPKQKKIKTYKPSLEEAVIEVKKYCYKNKLQMPAFNIELKSHPEGYGKLVPYPSDFVAFVIGKIKHLNMEHYTTLQSFDINVLEELNKVPDRKFNISYLTQNTKSFKNNLKKLTFLPDFYSPHFKTVKKKTVKQAHFLNIKVITWTVNTQKQMQKLILKKVDGIITDYPDLIFVVQ
jgi:glycerophosphoryl diester phosphodiesterase